MKRILSLFLTALFLSAGAATMGSASAAGLSEHIQVTSYDPGMDYTAAIQRALQDGSAYAMQVGAIYEQQRNLKIRDQGLDLEETTYFQDYTTAEEFCGPWRKRRSLPIPRRIWTFFSTLSMRRQDAPGSLTGCSRWWAA